MSVRFRRPAAAALVACCLAAPARAQAPDLIVTNAKVTTVDEKVPTAEAFAVAKGRITFVGTSAAALKLKGASTRVVDAKGQAVIPGIIDAHAHLSSLAQALRMVDLTGTKTLDELLQRVAARAKAEPGTGWLGGHGWDQNAWPGKQFPTKAALDAVVKDRPVILGRIDGHAIYVNSKALAAAGITAATKDVPGGRIERDAKGEPTGVFVDNAMGLVRRVVPGPTREEQRTAVTAAIAYANSQGLTGVHDAGVSPAEIALYEEMAKAGSYNLRNYIMIMNGAGLDSLLKVGPRSDLYDGRIWVRSIKVLGDGAMGSRGAALLEPYADDAKNRGLLIQSEQQIHDVAVKALKAGFQVNTHEIGDRGNRTALDAYEKALGEVPTQDHRFRIEHAQILDLADIPRFAMLKVLPSMQSSHQTSDMYWVKDRLGERRLAGAYAWRSLLKTGVIIPNGTDFPVEQVSPFITFHSAVTRQDAKSWPAGGWRGQEKMTREEAIKSITLWPAIAGFQEKDLGSITVGKRADFVILDHDLMTTPDAQLLDTKVVATYLGGKPVYEKK
ncbi:MAG: amidohydrolase [Gemmatimonadetes bacterium]|nr:amidohydrolase [Gemmatimonadota bacterium]